MKKTLILALALGISAACGAREKLDLSGKWTVDLKGFPESEIMLPGTTDAAGLGHPDTLTPKLARPQLLRLTRRHSYEGPAVYTRTVDIPADMAGKPLELTLGRVIWRSRVSVDGKPLEGVNESLTTPHRFMLPPLSAGKHRISIEIDNSEFYRISGGMAHAYSNETQTKWNGILGEISLAVVPEIDVRSVDVYPYPAKGEARVVAGIWNSGAKKTNASVSWDVSQLQGKPDGAGLRKGSRKARLLPGENRVEWNVAMKDASTWSEFDPALYHINVVASGDTLGETFGMRSLESRDGKLLLNGRPAFMRGTLECCIFPLTGTPPTDAAGWEKEFAIAKKWGLNHFRFHSWCPPEAAFEVADRNGFYLQIELPLWNEIEKDAKFDSTKKFLADEYQRIVREYGNHPSFMLMTVGNELGNDFDWLNSMVKTMRATDPRHLYAATSFTFSKGHSGHPEPHDQFFVTQWTDDGWVRGQGMFDHEYPTFDRDYAKAMAPATVPLISHEIGQYAVYPDLKEAGLYTGCLAPHNFEAIAADLQKKGRLDRAADYLKASGRLAALLYKEDIERAMRTPGFSGYQLLGLQDFSGQGTALVGLVNAFWDSKGAARPEWFRRFAAPVVPLARFEKAVYTDGEPFKARLQVANYSLSDLQDARIAWNFTNSHGDVVAQGKLTAPSLSAGLNEAGEFRVEPGTLKGPERYELTVKVNADTLNYSNSWNVWVYPSAANTDAKDVLVTRSVDEAVDALAKGRKVLLTPPADQLAGIESHFVPVFWSPVHFPNQAGGMGLLVDKDHPALELFPTDINTDWQWWYPLKHGRVIESDSIAGAVPIVEVVDNFTNNRALGMLYEAKVGDGKLIVSGFDLVGDSSSDKRDPAMRQLLASILAYMNSPRFAPSGSVPAASLPAIVKKK